jgi:hypothetical protein
MILSKSTIKSGVKITLKCLTLRSRYNLVNDHTPITGGDMNPEEYFDSENVFTSSGRHIPEDLVKRAARIYKKVL